MYDAGAVHTWVVVNFEVVGLAPGGNPTTNKFLLYYGDFLEKQCHDYLCMEQK
jgi:hypothetical protein